MVLDGGWLCSMSNFQAAEKISFESADDLSIKGPDALNQLLTVSDWIQNVLSYSIFHTYFPLPIRV